MNPYAVRAMIKKTNAFIGRVAETRDLYNLLASMQSCSIVGPRRIGKSSLLYHLTQPQIYFSVLPDPESYIFAFMDLQELAGLEPDDFFSMAIERLQQSSNGKLDISLGKDGTVSGFRRFLARTRDQGVRLVLCLDEFEMISRNERFGADFFTYLRGLCSNYSLALVTSSRASLYDLCHQGDIQTSQFWNIFVERTLGLMPESEALALIKDPCTQAGGEISDKDVAHILELAGRHPFFIQMACYHLFESKSSDLPINFDIVERNFFNEAYRHYAYAWEQLDAKEKNALISMAQNTYTSIDKQVLQSLQQQALVTRDGKSPSLQSAGWKRFISEKIISDSVIPQQKTKQETLPITTASKDTQKRYEYANFDIKVERVGKTSCRVMVLDSPAGQDDIMCDFPFDLDEIGNVMVSLGSLVRRGAEASATQKVTPTKIGAELFDTIFSGAVGQLFFESLGEARSRGQGLRIKIHVDPEDSPELAALPWEYLYNNRRRQFLSLNHLTPIIRYLHVQAPTSLLPITPPLRVLVAIASPKGYPTLDLQRERDAINNAWGKQSDVAVEFLDDATPSALQARLWDWHPHVVHFMGHGTFDSKTGSGALLFVNGDGNAKKITGEVLGTLLRNTPSVRLAFLNACQSAVLARSHDLDPFSGVAAALVMAGLPAVVAMQFPISDHAALAFANSFYPRLAKGDPVDVAVAFGREALHLNIMGSQEWGTPVLFMRVDDGLIFH